MTCTPTPVLDGKLRDKSLVSCRNLATPHPERRTLRGKWVSSRCYAPSRTTLVLHYANCILLADFFATHRSVTHCTDISEAFCHIVRMGVRDSPRTPGARGAAMISKIISAMLVIALLQGSIVAQVQSEGRNQSTAEIQKVVRNAEKRDKSVLVILNDGGKLTGKISNISDEGFALTNRKTRATKNYQYSDVREVRQKGLSKSADIIIGVGILVGVVVGILFAVRPKT